MAYDVLGGGDSAVYGDLLQIIPGDEVEWLGRGHHITF